MTAKIFHELCERREDFNNFFGVALTYQKHNNGFAVEAVPVRGQATEESVAKATSFLGAFAMYNSDNECDVIPFPSVLKPLFKDCLGGHLRNIIEMENNVRLDQLDSSSHDIAIFGDADGRLEVLSQLLEFSEVINGKAAPPNEPTDHHVQEQLEMIFREVKEPDSNKRQIYALPFGAKRFLSRYLNSKNINFKRIRDENSQVRAAPVPSATPPRIRNAFLSNFNQEAAMRASQRAPTPPEIVNLLDDSEVSHPRAPPAEVNPDQMGERIFNELQEINPDWDLEGAQMEWLVYVEDCKEQNRPVNYREAMERIKKVAAPPAEPAFDTSINQAIGQQIIREIEQRHKNWNIEKAQLEMLKIIEECNEKSMRVDVNEALRRIELEASFDLEDLTIEEDDEPMEKLGIEDDVIQAWFTENYEDSKAYNMSIYKSDLFKDFTSHFELYYSGENHTRHYLSFIEVIHNFLSKNKAQFPNVKTKGNTGVNAKKRFQYLRRKGTDNALPVEIPSPRTQEDSIPAPILVEQSFRSVQKAKKNEGDTDRYTLKCPWNPQYSNLYPGGEEGDPSCRRIVIDGSNIARSHGKVGEIKRQHKAEMFSIIGIKITVEHFWSLGCRSVTVFLPHSRQGNKGSPKIPEKERKLQEEMEKEDIIKYTPGRYHKGTKKFIQAYDDRYILDMAKAEDGIVVSNDQYRDLYDEFMDVINWRLLPFVMTADRIMIHAQDLPFSAEKPRVTLEQFIRKNN
ncbi:Oidioi.mRNA.OKI2018_I69.chr2.g7603.t1.cds [Oikopleura dioica]|uniref:Oidioi.mRNA.OKI2018_I69.chr2.g7603.t1.cds n=1 Tax=Oikopleura dioica TaxID=34765 RepID=A0ABN7T7Q6_OIKDI|nr:Oidioi.mRNA.OKI2018_I69.chr2.g7603.t1.cds [Oikopleura dioica]